MGIDRIESRLVVEEVAQQRATAGQRVVREPVQRKIHSSPTAQISSVTQRGPIGRLLDKVVGRPQRVEVLIERPAISVKNQVDGIRAVGQIARPVVTSFLQNQVRLADIEETERRAIAAAKDADRLEQAYDAFMEMPTAITGVAAMSALDAAFASNALPIDELETISASLKQHNAENQVWPKDMLETLQEDNFEPELRQVEWRRRLRDKAAAEKARRQVLDNQLDNASPFTPEEELLIYGPPYVEEIAEPDWVTDLVAQSTVEPVSTDALGSLGISPVLVEATYSDIFIVYHYRDTTCLIDGDRRLGEAMDMAFTRRGAFCALVRMAQAQYRHSVSFDRLEDFGLSPDDPQLEELCQVLNQLTGDTYDASPYETSIDTKFLGFLQ